MCNIYNIIYNLVIHLVEVYLILFIDVCYVAKTM